MTYVMSQIGGARSAIRRKSPNWIDNAKTEIRRTLLLTQNYMFADEYVDGEIVTGEVRTVGKSIINVGKVGAGKSVFTNALTDDLVQWYGEENTDIYVGYDMFSILGKWNATTSEFEGGMLGDKLCNIVVIEDALTYLGKKSKVINEVTQVFQNMRHLGNYKDANDNSVGAIVVIMNVQDYLLLNDELRRDWDFTVLRTIPSNEYHKNRLKRVLPLEAFKHMEQFKTNLRRNIADQSYKSKCVVDFDGEYGFVEYERVNKNYTKKNGEYWISSSQSQEAASQQLNLNNSVDDVMVFPNALSTQQIQQLVTLAEGKKYTFVLNNTRAIPIDYIDRAFKYGLQNPFPIGSSSKYKADKHWIAAYKFLVEGGSSSIIAEDLGVSDQMLTNTYGAGGYVAIVVEEQMGHWLEEIIPDLFPDMNWKVIAGNGRSDLMNAEAIASGATPGVGIHGEIKTKRRKRTPADDWISNEMALHILNGGKSIAYQIEMRRNRAGMPEHTLYTYDIFAETNNFISNTVSKSIKTINIAESPIVSVAKPSKRRRDMV